VHEPGRLHVNRCAITRAFILTAVALGMMSSSILPVSATTESAPPAPPHVAGLIVDYGGGYGAMTYAWIPFPDDRISGVDLLRLSGLPILIVGFGGKGEAVCKIVKTGCDVSPCRQRLCQTANRSSPYWRYLRLQPDGMWRTQALGGSSSIVTDGVIDAWVWAAGDSTPKLPVISLATIAERAGAGTADQFATERQALRPFVRTTGDNAQSGSGPPSSPAEYQFAAGLLIMMAGSGGVLVWRSRSRSRSRPRS